MSVRWILVLESVEGAGLSFHIARKYLDLHNAKIWAESEGKNKGSTFFVELPMQ